MDRRIFLASSFASPLLPRARSHGEESAPHEAGIFVPAGQGRDKEVLKLAGIIPMEIKVSTKDTGGNVFVFEHRDMPRGGPHRHVHFELDEWFYILKGEFVFEVGDGKYRLKPGDSVFAPRKVPHVWACVSDTGTLLAEASPAGTLETFLRDLAELDKPPTDEEAARAYAAHGMKLLGPPLKLE